MAVKHISVRIDDKTLNKLRVVSDYEGRSASSQVLMLIRKMIQEFEQEHGNHPARSGERRKGVACRWQESLSITGKPALSETNFFIQQKNRLSIWTAGHFMLFFD